MKANISKEDSLILKGIAVIMIILVHINWSRTDDFIFVGGQQFMCLLSKISAPVPIFTFVGGVGLAVTHRKGCDKHRVSRIIKLYLHMWIIMGVFVPMAFLMHEPRCYPSGLTDFIDNMSGLYATWNGTYWFVLPYAILSLSSRWLFGHLNKVRTKWIIFASFLLYFCAYVMRWLYGGGEVYILHNGLLSLPVNVMLLQFSFLMGYATVRCNVVARLSKVKCRSWVYWIIFLMLVLAKIFLVGTGFFFDEVYAASCSIIFVMLSRNLMADKIFSVLGRHSLNIWFLHGWLIMGMFAPFTYRLRYSAIILLAVLITCTLGSFVVNKVCEPIQNVVEKTFNN